MKRIVMQAAVGLVAIGVMGAFAGSAAAAGGQTVLCTQNLKPCPAADIQPVGSWFTVGAIGSEAIKIEPATTSKEAVRCEYALFAAQTVVTKPSYFPAQQTEVTTYIPAGQCFMGTSPTHCSSVGAPSAKGELIALGSSWDGFQGYTLSFRCYSPSTKTEVECSYGGSVWAENEEEGRSYYKINEVLSYSSGSGTSLCGTSATLTMSHGRVASSNYMSYS